MKKKFTAVKAFTLPEMLIVLGIISIVSVTLMTTIKPSDKYLKFQYYSAYNTLQTASYNVFQDMIYQSQKKEDEALEKGEAIPELSGEKVKLPLLGEFSKALTTRGTVTVDGETYDNVGGYINTVEATYGSTVTSGADSEFTTPSFITANGMKFYQNNATLKDGTSDYRLFWVDLNGDKKPNSADFTKHESPDIVAFMVNDTGYVIPVGYATIDPRYLITHVDYAERAVEGQTFNINKSKITDEARAKMSRVPYTYMEGRTRAYNKVYEQDPMSYNLDSILPSMLKLDGRKPKKKGIAVPTGVTTLGLCNSASAQMPSCLLRLQPVF